ncbi:MAG: ABC transporter substrate-binding protein, partial [Acidimicrobiales bacterium]
SNTTTLTRKLVLQNQIFADVGSLGTPTQTSVQAFLNAEKVPQLFVESGCNCWTDPKYPTTTGWQPPYTVDGKVLGAYIKSHFAGKKVGYLTQDDEFGQDVVKGLDREIPASSVVSRQTYDVATLAGPLTTQVSALQAAGAQVVVTATVPAATALTLLPAAEIGYKPQWVVDAVGADPPTVGPLLSSFTSKGGGSSSQASAAVGLLSGIITNAYLPAENDASNGWIQVDKKLLQKYTPSIWNKYGLDGNTEYGLALAYTFVQALQAAGKNLTRSDLVSAIAKSGKSFVTPGLVPLSYSSSNHFGYQGGSVVQISASAPPIVTPTGSFPGFNQLAGPYVTSPNGGPVKKFTGKASKPPSKLARTA